MAYEIVGKIEYEHLLAHTFPGFFSAITLFMLFDLLSPINLGAWVIKDIESLIIFIGFVTLIGTILGVIIDGLHHSIIEGCIFVNFIGVKEQLEFSRALFPQTNIEILRPYYFKKEKALDIDRYMTNKIYRYSEFYANTFIELIPLSLITPFYLFYILPEFRSLYTIYV